MISICLGLVAWILSAKCGMRWDGVTAAVAISIPADFFLFCLLILCLTGNLQTFFSL